MTGFAGATVTIFEHLSVLLSLILSLGIASLLLGVARLAQEWRRVVFSWPHGLWTFAIFLAQILFWLYAFSFRHFEKTSVIGLALPIALVTAVFLQGALATPGIPEHGEIDLRAFHASHRFQYLGAMMAYYAMFEIFTVLLSPLISMQLSYYLVPAIFFFTAALAFAFKTRWVQAPAALVQIVLQLAAFPALVATLNR